MIKIAHEAPLFWFDEVQQNTSIDYALVHLFESNPEYFDKFVAARQAGRHVILDNSIFELGSAFAAEPFVRWINLLKPAEYIVPDVLEDAEGTVASLQNWVKNYWPKIDLRTSPIGVVQGKTWEELVWCYKEIEPYVNRVAISFDYSYYETDYSYFGDTSNDNKLIKWSRGRQKFLTRLDNENIINREKGHHLLGLALPYNLGFYRHFPWITSIDTSNPVMWALEQGYYPPNYDMNNIHTKPKTKLFTLMDYKPETSMKSEWITKRMVSNIRAFRVGIAGE